jgi:hypothetical protein
VVLPCLTVSRLFKTFPAVCGKLLSVAVFTKDHRWSPSEPDDSSVPTSHSFSKIRSNIILPLYTCISQVVSSLHFFRGVWPACSRSFRLPSYDYPNIILGRVQLTKLHIQLSLASRYFVRLGPNMYPNTLRHDGEVTKFSFFNDVTRPFAWTWRYIF